ncbi:lipopolysaccharide biosynthesis protein [Prevotella sp. P6B4]|uniref:lipopolysaccharide biosynthesis protein n=1 Tax=Prevotella sp. P6B4 TaxID=1410614 RepID=UPI00048DEC09|nr:polysaccharide biosynthesis protein [Prevotella sp. P6B4]
MASDNKTIAKNTMALYFRMGITMLVGLFTSRVILQVLGVTDMGINATVGGVVAFAGFLNAALSNGTSRFLTVALGKGDKEELKSTFSTCFWVHFGLALILVLLVETVGLWFLYNKLIIPADRMDAAVWVFHLSVISMVATMTQVPYGACLIAHERMDMYAYTSLIDVFLKLMIVYALTLFDVDKLKLYSTLFFCTSMGMLLFYRWFCATRFEECRVDFKFDKRVFKPILVFSGWQLFANISISLNSNGILMLLNMFFSPAVVAARAISLQVNSYATQFMTNFRTAANPQIIKKYAAGDYEGSKHLLLESTKYCYYMMLMLSLPIYLLSYQLLYLWLGQVPEYCDIFLKLVVIQSLFQIFDTGLYTAIYADGNIKWNALTSPTIGFIAFPVVYVLFKFGASPIALSWVFIVVFVILGCIQKPLILIKICGYTFRDFIPMYWSCLKVTIISTVIPVMYDCWIRIQTDNQYLIFFSVVVISVLSVCASSWCFGIDASMREKVIQFVKNKIQK